MSVTTSHPGTLPREEPLAVRFGPVVWARANLFNSWWSTAVTLALGYLLIRGLMDLFTWGVLNADARRAVAAED